MKVGDLVKYIGRHAMRLHWHAGLVTGFDEDDDPIVLFFGQIGRASCRERV